MATLEKMADAALNRDNLLLRSLTQDLLRETSNLSECPKPQTTDSRILAAAASLVELLALHSGQEPPQWTRDVGALSEPVYLAKAAETMKGLRAWCETEAPAPCASGVSTHRPISSNLPD